MRSTVERLRVTRVAGLVFLGLLVMGADKGGCGPIDPPPVSADQCAAAADCEGLPHVMCLGDWACQAGACKWQCSTTPLECTQDSQCPDGQACRMEAVCPACTRAVPPCEAPCQWVGHCGAIEPLPTCVTGGCSGELCVAESQAGVASDCMYQDGFKCLEYSVCGNFGENGACGWQQTDAYLACLAGQGCGSNEACPVGYVCTNGACVVEPDPVMCASDADCAVGEHCSNSDGACLADPTCPMCQMCMGQCVPRTQPICLSDADCGEGEYCLLDSCPADANCADPEGNCLCAGTCQPNVQPTGCQTDADCPEGQRCYWTGGCPPCDCGADGADCACPTCLVAPSGTCGPWCDPNVAEICGNGLDDNCNGIVDENCPVGPTCMTDAECAPYEYCDYSGPIYDAAGNLACCPPNAKCTAQIPSCGAGSCRLQAGYCWTDADCVTGESCVGAFRCPEGAACFAPDQPGRCSLVDRLPCQSDAECPEGQACQWTSGCLPCTCPADDPNCACPMCMPALNGWCVPGGCVDRDGDGYCAGDDCDDGDAAIHRDQPDGCDGVDNDCDGLVDEDCKPQCLADTDCAAYEYCRLTYLADGSGIACCPPNAFCDATIPPCGGGVCVLQPGYCWTDADCDAGQVCKGAIVCPPGAMCFVANRPGTCAG